MATLCYDRGNRYATVVAYALLRLWQTLSAWWENNEHDGMWITNDKVLSSLLIRLYHRLWHKCAITVWRASGMLAASPYIYRLPRSQAPNNKNKIRAHPPKSATIRVPSPEASLKDG
ncbi:MAG: hypothetical protein J6K41_12810 [Paraprevotella sp.]|nr:hypothetical protein [Paraprevotella sp.]